MNGYEFVEKIIGETNYDVGPLIKLNDSLEVDWLEFKAATKPKDNQYAPDTGKWDYRWHVSKALFALANNIGGAVVVGIGETMDQSGNSVEAVSLGQSGFKGDKDKFMSSFCNHILSPDSWKTRREGTWKCTERHDLFTPFWGTFDKNLVIIILVKPRKKEDKWLELIHEDKSGSCKKVLKRKQGSLGQTEKIPRNDLDTWWENREVDRSDLTAQYNNFLSEWESSGKHSDAEIEQIISSYLQSFKDQYKSEHYDTEFISLNAEKLNDVGLSSPSGLNHDVLELMAQQDRTVLLGDPGAGKSTYLRRKTFAIANEWQCLDDPCALFIPLYEYTDLGLRSLILKLLPGLYWIDIRARINKGEITLLFDALNECPSVRYEECHQQIKMLLDECPNANITISSRLTHKPYLNRFQICNILHMNQEQQQRFLEVYHERATATDILKRLRRQSGAIFITRSPVLLKMVSDIWSDGGDFPEGLAKLYQRYLKVWHKRELEKNLQSGTPTRQWFNFHRVRDALAELAFKMRTNGKVSCSMNFARDTLTSVLGDDVGRFLERIDQGLLMKVEEDDEFLHFSHETIQEYLAAEYLAEHPGALKKDMLEDTSGKRSNHWAMPLVFAFELLPKPSKEFLQNAWLAEPMLVSAALRDNSQLNSLPIHEHEDLWLRGVLRALRGETNIPETNELAYISHFPDKKNHLPNVLAAALRGTSFWYSGQSHQEGKLRLERLKDLILDRNSDWIELLEYAITGQPIWKTELSLGQRLLIGAISENRAKTVLEDATIFEMCILARKKRGGYKNIVTSNWESSLRSDDTNLTKNLIALLRLRLNKELTKPIKFSHFSNEQQTILRNIGQNWKLSYRLLNVLIREGIVTPKDIRDEPGRLEDIISRTSAMNFFKFLKNGTIERKDIPDERFKELLGEMEKKNKKFVPELHRRGLLTKDDEISSRKEKGYTTTDLDNKYTREKIDVDLRARDWDVTVLTIVPQKNFGFVEHPSFRDNIFLWLDNINNPDNKTIVKGDILRVGVKTQFNKAKSIWGFAVTFGSILKKFSVRG
jgi:hypothetical protein